MTRSNLCLTVLAITVLVGLSCLVTPMPIASAAESCRRVTGTRFVDGVVRTVTTVKCDPIVTDGDDGQATSVSGGAIDTDTGIGICIVRAQLAGGDPDLMCRDQDEPPQVTPGLVARALQSTPLPDSVLQVQPPNGRTLVNFATNFLTESAPFTRTLSLLGQRVELRVFPARFTWRFDDGAPLTTTTPGARYPDLQVTHDYRRTGAYTPSVDTTYAADWRVGGGAWQRVPGTVTVAGDPVALQAVEARPTLVSSSR